MSEKTRRHLRECSGRFRLAELFTDLPQQLISVGVSYWVIWPFWPKVLVQPTAPISTRLTLVVPDPKAQLLSSVWMSCIPLSRCSQHDPWIMAPQKNPMATWQHHPLGFQVSFSLWSVFYKEDPWTPFLMFVLELVWGNFPFKTITAEFWNHEGYCVGSGIHTGVTLPRACDRSFLWLVWFIIVHMVLVSLMLSTALSTQSPSCPPVPVTVPVRLGTTALCFLTYLLLLSALGTFPGSAEMTTLVTNSQHTKTIFFQGFPKPKPNPEVLSSLSSELLPSDSACSDKRSTMPGTLISARELGAPHLGEHMRLLGSWLL